MSTTEQLTPPSETGALQGRRLAEGEFVREYQQKIDPPTKTRPSNRAARSGSSASCVGTNSESTHQQKRNPPGVHRDPVAPHRAWVGKINRIPPRRPQASLVRYSQIPRGVLFTTSPTPKTPLSSLARCGATGSRGTSMVYAFVCKRVSIDMFPNEFPFRAI